MNTIKIKNKNLCKPENLKGPFDNLTQLVVNKRNTFAEDINDMDKVTDIVSLNSYKGKNYFAASFKGGKLKIYNDNFENKIPIKVINVFDPDEGFSSMKKSYGNFLILTGYSKIKRIYLSDDLKNYKVINEIDGNDQIFKMAIEINLLNAVIAINILNEFLFYNLEDGNLLKEITESFQEKRKKQKEEKEEKEITYIDKLCDYYIITKISNQSDKLSLSESDLCLNKDIYSVKVDKPIESNTLWKIYELEVNEDKIAIKNQHLFYENIHYLGKINDFYLLLFNNKLNSIFIFELVSYNNILELSFDSFMKPLFSFPISMRNDLLDLLIVCEEQYICQYTLNLKVGIIYILSCIKIEESNDENINLLDSFMINNINKEDNKKSEKKIKKIVNFSKDNYIFLTQNNLIYNLKITN